METTPAPTAGLIPPDLLEQVEALAAAEHRPARDMVRELIEHGLNDRRWRAHAEAERQRARDAGLPDDGQAMSDEYRQSIRAKIAQGLASLREGKGSDGEAFMARMDAELAGLERQGR